MDAVLSLMTIQIIFRIILIFDYLKINFLNGFAFFLFYFLFFQISKMKSF